jgi:hypothetical protein
MKIPAVISMGSEEWLKKSVAGTGTQCNINHAN